MDHRGWRCIPSFGRAHPKTQRSCLEVAGVHRVESNGGTAHCPEPPFGAARRRMASERDFEAGLGRIGNLMDRIAVAAAAQLCTRPC